MKIAPKLATTRLSLVPIQLRDILFYWQLAGCRNVRQYLGGPIPSRQRVSQFRRYLRGHPNVGIWVVRPSKQTKAIGLILLSPHKDGVYYEVSYQFLPSSWGQGFASEAVLRVIEHALSDLGMQKVIAETQAANAASCRLLVRLGFCEEQQLERFGAQQKIFAKSWQA